MSPHTRRFVTTPAPARVTAQCSNSWFPRRAVPQRSESAFLLLVPERQRRDCPRAHGARRTAHGARRTAHGSSSLRPKTGRRRHRHQCPCYLGVSRKSCCNTQERHSSILFVFRQNTLLHLAPMCVINRKMASEIIIILNGAQINNLKICGLCVS